MDGIVTAIVARGDLAHLALLLWGVATSGLLWWTLRELSAANRRFEDFVREIAALNALFNRKD